MMILFSLLFIFCCEALNRDCSHVQERVHRMSLFHICMYVFYAYTVERDCLFIPAT